MKIAIKDLTIDHIKSQFEYYKKSSNKYWLHEETDDVFEEILKLIQRLGIGIAQAYKLYDDLEMSKIENGVGFWDYLIDEDDIIDEDDDC